MRKVQRFGVAFAVAGLLAVPAIAIADVEDFVAETPAEVAIVEAEATDVVDVNQETQTAVEGEATPSPEESDTHLSWAVQFPVLVDGAETTTFAGVSMRTEDAVRALLADHAKLTPEEFAAFLTEAASDLSIETLDFDGLNLLDAVNAEGSHVVSFSTGLMDFGTITVEPATSEADEAQPVVAPEEADPVEQSPQANVEPSQQAQAPVENEAPAAAPVPVAEPVTEPVSVAAPEAAPQVAPSATNDAADTSQNRARRSTTQRPIVTPPAVAYSSSLDAEASAGEAPAAEEPSIKLPITGVQPSQSTVEAIATAMRQALPKAVAVTQNASQAAPTNEVTSSASRAALFALAGAGGMGLVIAGTIIAIRRIH